MSVKKNLHEALKKYFGFDSFKSNQEAIITHLLAGKDVFRLDADGWRKVTLLPTSSFDDGGNGRCHFTTHRLNEKSG